MCKISPFWHFLGFCQSLNPLQTLPKPPNPGYASGVSVWWFFSCLQCIIFWHETWRWNINTFSQNKAVFLLVCVYIKQVRRETLPITPFWFHTRRGSFCISKCLHFSELDKQFLDVLFCFFVLFLFLFFFFFGELVQHIHLHNIVR